MINLWQDLLNWTGTSNVSGGEYGFFSGFGSDLGELTLIVALITWWKANECHVEGCHRRGSHPFKHYRLCRVHHPGVPKRVTHVHVKNMYNEVMKKEAK